jgi:plasmid segregation protein ParM
MDEALARLAQMGRPFDSRKKLVDWLIDSATKPLMRAKRAEAMKIVEAEINIFTEELNRKFATVLERNGAFAEVVYVYGGGASPVKIDLYPALIEKSKSFGGGEIACPILYLDSRYSRKLNREGLYVIADTYAKMSK